MLAYHVHLNTLTGWCLHKALCPACHGESGTRRESQVLYDGLNVLQSVLLKRSVRNQLHMSSFYLGDALRRFQTGFRHIPNPVSVWDYGTAEKWLQIKDLCYLTDPDQVSVQTLVDGGIPYSVMPTFRITDNHNEDRLGRLLQFLYDYFGFARVAQFQRVGVLRPLLLDIQDLPESRYSVNYVNPTFHRTVVALLFDHLISTNESLYGERLLIEVILDTYFADVDPGQREDMQYTVSQYMGLLPTCRGEVQ